MFFFFFAASKKIFNLVNSTRVFCGGRIKKHSSYLLFSCRSCSGLIFCFLTDTCSSVCYSSCIISWSLSVCLRMRSMNLVHKHEPPNLVKTLIFLLCFSSFCLRQSSLLTKEHARTFHLKFNICFRSFYYQFEGENNQIASSAPVSSCLLFINVICVSLSGRFAARLPCQFCFVCLLMNPVELLTRLHTKLHISTRAKMKLFLKNSENTTHHFGVCFFFSFHSQTVLLRLNRDCRQQTNSDKLAGKSRKVFCVVTK